VIFKFPDLTPFFLTRGILRRTWLRSIHVMILRRTCEKKCPSPKYSTINLTRSGWRRELVLRGETPATNCLSHCTVRSLELAVLSNVPDFRKNIAFWKVSRLCHLSLCWERKCRDYGVLVGLYGWRNTAVLGEKPAPVTWSWVYLTLYKIIQGLPSRENGTLRRPTG